MDYFEKAALKFLLLTYISFFLIGLRYRFTHIDLITNEDTIDFTQRKSLYVIETTFHIFRIMATLKVIYQRRLAYSFSVHFLSLYMITIYVGKLFQNNMFSYFLLLEIIIHVLYAYMFFVVYLQAKEKFLLTFLGVVGCNVRTMRMFMVRKKIKTQRYLLFTIILLRNLTYFFDGKIVDNIWFLASAVIDLILVEFERYEIKITKIFSIMIWCVNGGYITYLLFFAWIVDDEFLFRLRVFLFLIIIYIYVSYNVIDFFFYGYGINKILLK